MENLLQLTFLTIVVWLCISQTNAADIPPILNLSSSTSSSSSSSSSTSSSMSSPALPPSPPHLHDPTMNPTVLLEPILTNLGFQELAMAVPSLTSDSTYTTWNGPSTLFAPTDSAIRSCGPSCSVPQLLREHMVPGIFSIDYLRKLAFGTKLETMSSGRCITVTSAINANRSIIYIGGVEITHPDLFYNGFLVVHRLEGFISLLSPFSCNIERMSSSPSSALPFPPQPSSINSGRYHSPPPPSPAIMRLMLRDAMLRLHNNGFSILALALRVKYPEIVNLNNMTVFSLDDTAIFAGGHAFLSNFRFHVVPNRRLMNADLMKLSAGTTLPTMDHGQTLMVTATGGGNQGMRINYVRIKVPDVVYNLKIVVHSVFLPFPHLHPTVMEFGGGIGGLGYDDSSAGTDAASSTDGFFRTGDSMTSCAVGSDPGACAAVPPTPTARE